MINQFFFRINETAQMLGVSRSKVYELLNNKELLAVKQNRKTLITRESLLDLVKKWNSSAQYQKGEIFNQ